MPKGGEQEIENLREKIVTENSPNLVTEIDIQVQAVQRISNKMNPKRLTSRCTIIKMRKIKDKERILKPAREKQVVTYKGVPVRLSAGVSTETLQATRVWQEIFKVMKSEDLQPRLLYPEKLSLRIEGHKKSFPNKEKTKGVHRHKNSTIRNVKVSSFGRKKDKKIET